MTEDQTEERELPIVIPGPTASIEVWREFLQHSESLEQTDEVCRAVIEARRIVREKMDQAAAECRPPSPVRRLGSSLMAFFGTTARR